MPSTGKDSRGSGSESVGAGGREDSSSSVPAARSSSYGQVAHLLALFVVAPLSMLAGFVLVTGALPRVGVVESEGARLADEGSPDRGLDGGLVGEAGSDGGGELDGQAGGPARLGGIPIRPAPRVTMGEPRYWRCYRAGESEPLHDEACGRSRPLERFVASHLGAVLRCYERLDMHGRTGTLSLAMDFDFSGVDEEGSEEKGRVRLWAGRSTDLEGAEPLVTCLRGRLRDVSLRGIRHQYQRYTVFFPIRFGPTEGEGTPVELVLDRVRLRREPVSGRILARLRKGEPVIAREVRDGWVKVVTADGREGWIFAEAITSHDL